MTPSSLRLETALIGEIDRLTPADGPPRLAKAIRYAIFPGGGRLRPRLCFAVAGALGELDPALTDAAAVSLEFLHTASLIQDDLPAFDAALMRRDRPAVHQVYGEALAILASDALILGAFAAIARAAGQHPRAAAMLMSVLARGAGTPDGAVAGQAWESELAPSLATYHRAKTGALFEAATAAGAIVAGEDPAPWRAPGAWLGRAYQLADDLCDAGSIGAGSDDALGRPNAVRVYGVAKTLARIDVCTRRAKATIPPCAGRDRVRGLIDRAARRLRPMAVMPPRTTPEPRPTGVALGHAR